MDKYLQQILKEVNTIIIPGLGALTITSAKTGDIYFMPFLKHDDNKLSNYISENENINHHDAKNIIAKYVREILAKLDQGETYDMYQFGRFIKNAHEEIEFQRWEDYQIVDRSILAASKRAKESTDKPVLQKDSTKEKPQDKHTPKAPFISNIETNEEEDTSSNLKEELALGDSIATISSIQVEEKEFNNTTSEENSITTDENNSLDLPLVEQSSIVHTNLDEILSKYDEEPENGLLEVDNEINSKIIFVSKETEVDSVIQNDLDIVDSNPPTIEIESNSVIEEEKVKDQIQQEENSILLEKPKKKRNDLVIWLIVGVLLASGILGYTLYQRKSEKIIIKERILAKSSHSIDKKDPIKKIVTTKIVSNQKSEVIKKEVITPKATPTHQKMASTSNLPKQPLTTKTPQKVDPKPVVTPTPSKTIPVAVTKSSTSNPPINKSEPKNLPLATTKSTVSKPNVTTPSTKVMPVATTKTESTKAIATPINSNTKNIPTPVKNTPVATKTPNITTTKVVPATITKTAVNNTTATNKPLPNPKPSSSTATGESSKIQLIAGSFKDKANAEKLVGTLKSQGYKNAHVSEFNGNYQVAIDSYSTLSETMKALKQYKKDAWVKSK